jgi:hypothetical protein
MKSDCVQKNSPSLEIQLPGMLHPWSQPKPVHDDFHLLFIYLHRTLPSLGLPWKPRLQSFIPMGLQLKFIWVIHSSPNPPNGWPIRSTPPKPSPLIANPTGEKHPHVNLSFRSSHHNLSSTLLRLLCLLPHNRRLRDCKFSRPPRVAIELTKALFL